MDINKLPTETLVKYQEELQRQKERAAKKFDRPRVVEILFLQAEIESILNSRKRQIAEERAIASFVRNELRATT